MRWLREKLRRKVLDEDESNLGAILVAMQVLSPAQVGKVVAKQKQDPAVRFGQTACALGWLEQDVLREALRLQALMREGKEVDAMLEIVEQKVRSTRHQMGEEVSGPVARWAIPEEPTHA